MNYPRRHLSDLEHQQLVDDRRAKKMARIDAMPEALRSCVHDYGFAVVDMLISLGIKEARHIRHVVERILDEFSPTRGCFSKQGVSTPLSQVEDRAQ